MRVSGIIGAVFEVPPVRYVDAAHGSIAYQQWGKGAPHHLLMAEYTTSVDNIWEHPGRVRFLSAQGDAGQTVRFDPMGQALTSPKNPRPLRALP